MILKNFGKNETRKPLVHKGYILDKTTILFSIIFFVILTNILAYAAGYSDGEQNYASSTNAKTTTTATSIDIDTTQTDTETETTITTTIATTATTTEFPKAEVEAKKTICRNNGWTESLYPFVNEVASYYGYNPEIILKIIYVESRFDAFVSNGYYTGLMQVSEYYGPAYREWGDKYDALINSYEWDLTNPEINIVIGTRMLKSWEDCSSNLVENLCHYNSGYEYEDTFYGELVLSVEL